MTVPHLTAPDLQSLLGLFYQSPEEFGQCTLVAAGSVPPIAQKLLAHHNHMTEVMEQHHGSPVSVEVLAHRLDGQHYARKILLRCQSDNRVVQFGIVRLNFACIAPNVRQEIEARAKPLGQILIEHNVLRTVRLVALWRIEPGPDLRAQFGISPGTLVYGRTALIYTNSEPAVELLEVAAPELRAAS